VKSRKKAFICVRLAYSTPPPTATETACT